MTMTMKTVTVPEKTEERCESVTCDVCGKTVGGYSHHYDGKVEWSKDDFAVRATTIAADFGTRYPSGGNVDHREYHVCYDCFTNKVEPFLRSLGASSTEQEEDY